MSILEFTQENQVFSISVHANTSAFAIPLLLEQSYRFVFDFLAAARQNNREIALISNANDACARICIVHEFDFE